MARRGLGVEDEGGDAVDRPVVHVVVALGFSLALWREWAAREEVRAEGSLAAVL